MITPSAPARIASDARLAARGTTAGALDIALDWDPAREGCDLIWRDGDWALDATVVTEMLMALQCDRRARPEDTLPDPEPAEPPAGQPVALVNRRRGWCGDGLAGRTQRTGSRIWLWARSKQTEATRAGIQGAAAEALALVAARRGIRIQLTVRWIGAGIIGIRAAAGAAVLSIRQGVAA